MAARTAALVLCGGRSRRMGVDKGGLAFGSETMLERVVARVRDVVDEVWLVAREGQDVPLDLPIARDPGEGLGPLAAVAAGLAATTAERAFVTACDAPLLEPGLVARLLELAEGHDGALPRIEGHLMPTTAVYGASLAPLAAQLLEAGRRRPRDLLEVADLRIVEADELRDVDPTLLSFVDCDTPEAYREALQLAGL